MHSCSAYRAGIGKGSIGSSGREKQCCGSPGNPGFRVTGASLPVSGTGPDTSPVQSGQVLRSVDFCKIEIGVLIFSILRNRFHRWGHWFGIGTGRQRKKALRTKAFSFLILPLERGQKFLFRGDIFSMQTRRTALVNGLPDRHTFYKNLK